MQRLHPLPAAAPRRRRRAGRGLPEIEPGMPLPAGTGLDRRTFLLRLGRRGAVGVRRLDAEPAPLRRGHRQAAAAAAAPNEPVLVSIFMEGGWDALSVLAPVEEARLQRTAPDARPRRRRRQGLHRGRKPDVAPVRRRPRRTARRGQGHGLPGDRLRARRTRATSRAATTGRSASSTPTRARAGWGATSTSSGEPDNPLQGLSLDYSLAPALATAKMPVAAVSSPADYTMWANGLGEPISAPALETFGALGALAAPSPAYAQARDASYDTGLVLEKMAGFVKSEEESGDKSPVTYPKGEFAERLAVLAAMLHTGHADQMRLAERGRLLRHPLRRGHDARHEPRTDGQRARRLPARPRSARARPARADRAVVGVRPAPAGKRLGHRPRRGRGRVPDRHARRRARWSASSPA